MNNYASFPHVEFAHKTGHNIITNEEKISYIQAYEIRSVYMLLLFSKSKSKYAVSAAFATIEALKQQKYVYLSSISVINFRKIS